MIKSVFISNSTNGELCIILQVDDYVILSGILNRECEVHPTGKIKAAIPEEPQHKTIFPCDYK